MTSSLRHALGRRTALPAADLLADSASIEAGAWPGEPPASRKLEWLARFLAWLAAPPGLRELIIALVLSAPVPLLMALASNVSITQWHQDSFIPIDAAWRTLQGQVPHFDFYTPLGIFYFWLHAAAARLWGMDARIIIWANFLALPFVLLPGIVLAWRRLGTLSAITLTILLTELVIAPTFIDGPGGFITHLANYNRIGWGFASLVCLWALRLPRRTSHGWDLAEAVAIGIMLFILFYLKLTYFALSVGIIAVGCVVTRGLWRGAAMAVLPLAAGMIALEILYPGLLGAYRADLARAAAANTILLRSNHVQRAVVANIGPVLLIGLLAALTFWIVPARRLAVLGALAVAGGSTLVATQNWGAFAPPLVVLVMLLAQWLEAGASQGGSDVGAARPILLTAGAGIVIVAALPFIFTQANGTLGHALLTRGKGYTVDGGHTETFRTMRWHRNSVDEWYFPPDFTVNEALRWDLNPTPDVMQTVMADGYDLVLRLGLPGSRIESLSFSNPFPAGLRWPDPRSVALWWDTNRTFTRAKLTPDEAVGDADIVMVPKIWTSLYVTDALKTVAWPKLSRDFTPHESRFWTAWVRNR